MGVLREGGWRAEKTCGAEALEDGAVLFDEVLLPLLLLPCARARSTRVAQTGPLALLALLPLDQQQKLHVGLQNYISGGLKK